MISTAGHTLLGLAIFLCISAVFFALLNRARLARYAITLNAVVMACAFFTLIFGFCFSDFSLQNVFMNSSNITPIIFRISGAWASHEGSILLWATMLSIVAGIWIAQSSRGSYASVAIPRGLKPSLASGDSDASLRSLGMTECASILILGLILTAFISFIYFACDPFAQISISPHQGLGLNPILQDVALAIHPPILYMGYVSSLPLFLYSCLALLSPRQAIEIMRATKNWAKFCWLMLLCGVGLGSWWAYRELGWGGFWFFDPVENISLMPLMAVTAYYHSLIYTSYNGKMMRWTLFLGLSVFLLTILGTFLVRCGLLTSVHAFADNSGRTIWLGIIFCILATSSLGLYAWSQVKTASLAATPKEKGVFWGNIIWVAGVIILLFAVIYPLALTFFGHHISVSVSYFTSTFIPLMIPTALLAGTFAYFKAQGSDMRPYYLSCIVAIMIVACVLSSQTSEPASADLGSSVHLSDGFLLATLALFSGIFLLISTIFKFLEKTNYFRQSLSSKMAGMLLSHAGYGLMFISISINSLFQSETDFIGERGKTIEAPGYKVTLRNIAYGQGENYYRQIAEFWIEDKAGQTLILRPENRFYEIENAITAESDIYSSLWADTYAVLSKVKGDVVHAKIYWRPGIGLLWISIIMMAGGIAISLFGGSSKPKSNA